MQIVWYGQSCFKVSTGDLTLIVSPFRSGIGLTAPRGKADITLLSDKGNGFDAQKSADAGFVIFGPGEYEISGIMITGFSVVHETADKKHAVRHSTAYVMRAEGMTLCHLDSVSKSQTEEILEHVGEVDILMVPVGGRHRDGTAELHTLNAEEAVSVVSQIEPRVVIPMYYKIPKLSVALEGVDPFLKAIGAKNVEPLEKYSAKKKDLPQEETSVVVLSAS